MHNWIELSFLTDTSPQKVTWSSWRKWSIDLLWIWHHSSALFALIHVVIYFVTNSVTQKELIRTGHPNVEGVLCYVHNVGKGAAVELHINWCSQWPLSLIQFKKHLLISYNLAYTEVALYNITAIWI